VTVVTFTLGADAVLDATAAAASAPLRPYRDAAEVSFCRASPLYLPASPYISLYLPVSPR